MKKFIFNLIIVTVLFFSSCEENFDPKIYGKLFSTNFPQTESDYEAYLMIGYMPFSGVWGYNFTGSSWFHPLLSMESGVVKLFDITSDYCSPNLINTWGESYLEWSQGDFTKCPLYERGSTGSRPSHFEKIREVTRLTEIIGTIQRATTLSETKQKNFTGEARLLRGLLMYYLLHIYGPIPVIVDPALVGNTEMEKNLERPTLEQMVRYIYDDLDFAQQNMTNTAPKGRYTADYAKFCLMRHCLNEGSYMDGYYDKVIEMYRLLKASSKNYRLFNQGGREAYADQFKQANKFNPEVIMALSTSANADGDINGDFNPLSFYVVPDNAAKYADIDNTIPTPFEKQGGGWGQQYNVAVAYYDAYETGDERKKVILTSYVVNDAERTVVTRNDLGDKWNGFILNKYPVEIVNPYQPTDFPLARWADVLLMYAEAVARKTRAVPDSEVMQAITEVRTRAGLAPFSGDAVADYDGFMEALLTERGHELLYEGHRKIDLIRFNKYRHNLKQIKNQEPTHQYLPLPDFAVLQAATYGKILTQTYERPDYDQDR
jgi:hypothetical protein